MGESWPVTWLNAADALRRDESQYITPAVMRQTMTEHGVRPDDTSILARWLHDLGDIIYYQDDEYLDDVVMLDADWVTDHVYRVLDHEDIDDQGIFTSDHSNEVWDDLDPGIRELFLRLMEQFDLSYRTLENRDISIVVEKLSSNPPTNYQDVWANAQNQSADPTQLSMIFDLKTTLPPGIPTWFIARQHRFTTETHWKFGAVLTDGKERKHMALVQALPQERQVTLTVRGPYPHNFFTKLRDGLEVTLERYPGLNIQRLQPCPGHDGNPCDYQFDLDRIEAAIERGALGPEIQCQTSFLQVSTAELLFGLHWSTHDSVISHMDDLGNRILEDAAANKQDVLSEIGDMRALLQRGFTALMETECPNVFAIVPVGRSQWRERLQGQQLTLHLYCQEPGQWHPTVRGGRYEIDQPAQWLASVAPYVRHMVTMLKYTAPVIGPWLGVVTPDFQSMFKNQLDLMKELVKKLPEVEDRSEPEFRRYSEKSHDPRDPIAGSALRALRQLLDDKDPDHTWGGLNRTTTPEGHILWLCDYHRQQYRN